MPNGIEKLSDEELLRLSRQSTQFEKFKPSPFEIPASALQPSWTPQFIIKAMEATEPWRQRTLSAGLGAVNVGLMGIPEIISQKLTGRRLVPAKAPFAKGLGEVAGFAGGVPSKVVGGVSGLAGKFIPSTRFLPSVLKGAITGAAAGTTLLPSPEDAPTLDKALETIGVRAKIGAGVGAAAGALGWGVGQLGKMRRYPKEKVLEIRKGAKQYHKDEVTAYGDMLDDLTKTGTEQVNITPTLEKMTQMMRDRGLVTPQGEWVAPLNKIDRQLVKSYEALFRQAQISNFKLPLKNVITEIQNIKNAGGSFAEPTQFGRMALETGQEVLGSIKPQIKSDVFLKGNVRYTDFKQNMEALDKYFDIWKSPILTGKGERFLMGGLRKTGEAQDIARIAAEKTGQTLRGGQLSSAIMPILRNPYVRWTLLGGGALGLGRKFFGGGGGGYGE